MTRRRFIRRLHVALGRVVPMILLVLLTLAVCVTAYVCSRKAMLIPPEAARWHQATQIRAYIAHLDASGSADAEWRAWALQVADEMDRPRPAWRQIDSP